MIDDDPEGYWKIINVEDLGLSDEFKKLFLKMISNNPEKRPSINQILNDPWLYFDDNHKYHLFLLLLNFYL